MKTLYGLILLFIPCQAYASNFGDLPRVLPVLYIGLVASLFVALYKAMEHGERGELSKFNILIFMGTLSIGVLISFLLTAIMWLFTL